MRRILIILACALVAAPAWVRADERAKEILDKAVEALRAYPAVEVDFDLTMVNEAEDIREKHSGKAFMKGDMYRVDVMDTENYFDGELIYTYMPEAGEVNIKYPEEDEEEMLNPTILFDIHNERFDQRLVEEKDGRAYVELTPKEEHHQIAKIGVWVDTKANRVEEVTSFGKDGNNVVVTIKSLKKPDKELADSFFKFDTEAHPDVEVVDLR